MEERPVYRLPLQLIERGLALADGCTFRGVPLADLSRDELMAVVAIGFDAQRRTSEEAMRQASFMSDICRAKSSRIGLSP